MLDQSDDGRETPEIQHWPGLFNPVEEVDVEQLNAF